MQSLCTLFGSMNLISPCSDGYIHARTVETGQRKVIKHASRSAQQTPNIDISLALSPSTLCLPLDLQTPTLVTPFFLTTLNRLPQSMTKIIIHYHSLRQLDTSPFRSSPQPTAYSDPWAVATSTRRTADTRLRIRLRRCWMVLHGRR